MKHGPSLPLRRPGNWRRIPKVGPVYATAASGAGAAGTVPADTMETGPQMYRSGGGKGKSAPPPLIKEVSIKFLERVNHPSFKWTALLCGFLTLASGGLDGRGEISHACAPCVFDLALSCRTR